MVTKIPPQTNEVYADYVHKIEALKEENEKIDMTQFINETNETEMLDIHEALSLDPKEVINESINSMRRKPSCS